MKLHWRSELLQWALILAQFVTAAVIWNQVPEQMPVHWNLAGEVDGYGGRFVGLLLVPLTTLGLYFLLLGLPYLDPGKLNYAKFAKTYLMLRTTMVVFMTVLYAVSIAPNFGWKFNMSRVIFVLVGLLLASLGNWLGKIRPNWFVGIRTPWTLSSKLSWTKTHRVAGWLFIVMGLTFCTALFLPFLWVFWAGMAVGGVTVLTILIYSWHVWRHDPDRVSPAGTQPAEPT